MKRMMCLALCLIALLYTPGVHAADKNGWVSIFDGKTLEGWDGKPGFWSVQDGAITGETKTKFGGPNTFIVWTGGELAEFELELEYRIGSSGNSGIQYRSFPIKDDKNKWRIGGYQADIDSGPTYSGINYGEAFRGILANRGQKTIIQDNGKPKLVDQFAESKALNKLIKKGEWNKYRITGKGYEFKHFINGALMSWTIDEDKDKRRDKGVLAFQLHAGPPMKVQFRNIRVKHLKPAAAE